jgi:hypothetical protein
LKNLSVDYPLLAKSVPVEEHTKGQDSSFSQRAQLAEGAVSDIRGSQRTL